MKLPELPRTIKKREANFTGQFKEWLLKNPMDSSLFELKQTTSDYISFESVKDHQVKALLAASVPGDGLIFKIPDDSRSMKPADMFYLQEVRSFVVIKFPNIFVGIPIFNFLAEKKMSNRKSITSDRALEICSFSQVCG